MTWLQRLSAYAASQRALNGTSDLGIARTRTAIRAWKRRNPQPRRQIFIQD